jgi:hypothetical protein
MGVAAWSVARFISDRSPRTAILSMGPLMFMPVVIVPMFGLSSAVVDWVSTRYSLPLWLFYAVAFASCVDWLWRAPHLGRKACAGVVAAALSLHGAYTLRLALAGPEAKGFAGEAAVVALAHRGIHHGYASYWYAYSISLATNEDIIFEPISNAYGPYYGPLVRQAQRIAWLEEDGPWIGEMPQDIEIEGLWYHKTDSWQGNGLAFAVLERTGS